VTAEERDLSCLLSSLLSPLSCSIFWPRGGQKIGARGFEPPTSRTRTAAPNPKSLPRYGFWSLVALRIPNILSVSLQIAHQECALYRKAGNRPFVRSRYERPIPSGQYDQRGATNIEATALSY
jgi:hypothetical protein